MRTHLFHNIRSKVLSLALLLLLAACKKEPGEGGTAVLSGMVETVVMSIDEIVVDGSITYDTTFIDRYPSSEKKVFIIYGDDDVHDDDTRADNQGRYQFRELYKGNYRLYVYSDCLDCPADKEPVFQTVEITANGEEVEVPLISIKKLD